MGQIQGIYLKNKYVADAVVLNDKVYVISKSMAMLTPTKSCRRPERLRGNKLVPQGRKNGSVTVNCKQDNW